MKGTNKYYPYIILSILFLLAGGWGMPATLYADDTIPSLQPERTTTGKDKIKDTAKIAELKRIELELDNLGFKMGKEQYVICEHFSSSSFENKDIDIYDYDLTKLKDTVAVMIHDSFSYKANKFCFPTTGHITSGFGPRNMFSSRFHYGVDVKLAIGDTLVSALDGVVRIVRVDPGGYGNFMVVTHTDGLETLYGHLSKYLVKVGDEVKAGEPIALGGNTGRSTGAHLHFEFLYMGEKFDPSKVVSFTDGEIKTSIVKLDKDWFSHLVVMRTARYHTIRSGDTLGGIARKYGTSISKLCRLNGMTTRSILRIGVRLRVN